MPDFEQLDPKQMLMIKWLRQMRTELSKAEWAFIEEISQLKTLEEDQNIELSLIYNRIREASAEPAPFGKRGIFYCDFERSESCGLVG